MEQILVTQVRSTNSASKKQIATMKALGLTKIGVQVLHDDNPAIRGMLDKVSHLVAAELVEVEYEDEEEKE